MSFMVEQRFSLSGLLGPEKRSVQANALIPALVHQSLSLSGDERPC